MKEIKVDLKDREYKVYIGKNIIEGLDSILHDNNISGKILIVTDQNVADLYLEKIYKCLSGRNVVSKIIQPSEESKKLDTVMSIYSEMIQNGCNRQTTVVGFGGGVVGDIAGFVASTYMRGVDFVQIPTTLLAQVDSSIGGKVAVNFNGYKNIIGSFYQPRAVIIDVNFLNTLENREFISGMGEVLKYGLIRDYNFFKWINKNIEEIMKLEEEKLITIIHKSLNIKKEIVEEDEKDYGIRRILNFGHTIGHGVEGLDNFKRYIHGEAVIMGMIYESIIGKDIGLISEEYCDEIIMVLSKLIKPIVFNDNEIKIIMEKIRLDKKTKNGRPVFVLPTGKGTVDIFENINEKLIIKALKEGLK